MKIKPTTNRQGVVVEIDSTDGQPLPRDKRTGTRPFKIQRILVPIDFSVCSRKALKYAVPFARQFGASLTLVSVVQIACANFEAGGIDLVQLQDNEERSARERLTALAAEEADAGITFETVVRSGQAMVEIVETAREREIDLIIISTHGYTGLKRVMVGSTTEKIVRHAPCPVLVVREREHEFLGE